MPYAYSIDVDHQRVLTRRWGRVTQRELFALYDDLQADRQFHPGMAQLADCREVDRVEVTGDSIRILADIALFGAGRRAIIVGGQDSHLVMSRIFETYAAAAGRDVRVFREVEPAERWLAELAA